MELVTIKVQRSFLWKDPEKDDAPRLVEYRVPKEEGSTVLQALMHIYEEIDSTLAFRYGCRYKRCGICTVSVNGHPKLACVAKLRDGLTIRPLKNVPVIKDLALDHSWMNKMVEEQDLYIPSWDEVPQELFEPAEHLKLLDCTECFACLDTCPDYSHGGPKSRLPGDQEGGRDKGGPFQFVKLAQLHYDPRDSADRVAQAAALAVERCASCQACYCVVGIPIYKGAIAPLLDRLLVSSQSGPGRSNKRP